MVITKLSQLDFSKTYSYFDYMSWKFNDRVELIKGKIFEMSPAPNTRHQIISSEINFALRNYLDGQFCRVFYAPFDVRLFRQSDEKESFTVVQPDICVVCDQTKIDDKGCNGAPELLIEILSPGNSKKELKSKFELYQEAGVLEYWIVDPEKEIVLQYVMIEGKFTTNRPLISDDILESKVLTGFRLKLSGVFDMRK